MAKKYDDIVGWITRNGKHIPIRAKRGDIGSGVPSKNMNSDAVPAMHRDTAMLAGNFNKGEPMSFEEADGNEVNPYYNSPYTNPSERSRYRTNCQSCVPAYEARRRGWKVEARERRNSVQDELSMNPENAWVTSDGKPPKVDKMKTKDHAGTHKWLDEYVKDGCRYQFTIFRDVGGHTLVAEKEGNKLKLYDPQTGRVALGDDIDKYLEDQLISYGRSPEIFRIDNLEFKEGVPEKIFYRAEKVTSGLLVGGKWV